MNTNACDFQLKVILHSYQNNSSFLVYNKKDSCFYGVGNISKINKNDHLTSTAEVTEKIKYFINANSSFFNKKLLEEFTTCLKGRISNLDSQTYGFFGILTMIYHVFNHGSKIRFQQQLAILKQLEESIQQVKESNSPLKNIEPKKIELFEKTLDENTLDENTLDENILDENTLQESTLEENIFETEKPKEATSQADQENSYQTPSKPPQTIPKPSFPPNASKSLTSNLSVSKPISIKKTVHFKTPPRFSFRQPSFPPFKSPALNTPSKNSSEFPSAPTPPPFDPTLFHQNSENTLNSPNPKWFPNQPDPLNFHLTNYKKLPDDEVSVQIEAIEAYVKTTTLALLPVELMVKKHKELRKKFKETKALLTVKNSLLMQCNANLIKLRKGESENTIVELMFKSQQYSGPILFFPTDIVKQMFNEKSVGKVSNLIKMCQQPLLQFPGVIKQFQNFADYFEDLIKKLERIQKKNKEEINVLEEKCQKDYAMDLKKLKENFTKLNEELKSWRTHCEYRKKHLVKPMAQKKPAFKIQSQNHNEENNDIFHKFPILKDFNFPIDAAIPLKIDTDKMNETNVEKIAEDFRSSFLGMLRSY